ncbi:hypothetical protein QQZ08_008533 [Neonectria magnoliae]|uniref:DJ-1/PfpI domain-containing protein n=1 Tax=Neonectria magnoliae TaxID=2732573 RepID=A0ABR1HTW4_9HYPO
MHASKECQHPLSWSESGFSLDSFSFVFLPGGRDRAVRQILDDTTVHSLLAEYFPQARRPNGVKAVGAICHGVLALANAEDADGQILGAYYKTYGAGSEDVEDSVKKCLKDPEKQ